MNEYIANVIIAPMTTKGRDYPTRVSCKFEGKDGQIVLDQIRTVDKSRMVKRLGKISVTTQKEVLTVLSEMFAE
jgi:mRNA interferase MazF